MPTRPPQPARGRFATAAVLLVVALTPLEADAQRQPFVDHLLAFRAALFGPYGDEGTRALEALEELSAALSAWDESLRAEEERLAIRLAGASGTDRVAVRTSLAELFAGRGRLGHALREIDAALALDPLGSQLHAFRGRLLDALGREPEAAAAYRRAAELDPSDALNAYLAFSLTSSLAPESGGPAMSALLQAERRAVRYGPRPIRELTLIADRVSTSPLFAPALYADGFDAVATGDYRKALDAFRAAAARDPLIVDGTSQSGPMSQGVARLRAGMMHEAIPALESAAALHEDSSEAHRILGATLAAIGNDATAVEHLRRAVQLAPTDERAHLALGRALRDAGRLNEAARALRQTLDVLPRSAEARWTLGGVLKHGGRPRDAAREYEAALSMPIIAGRSAVVWQVAEIYDQHQDFDRVVGLLWKRTRLVPNDPTAHRLLGLVQSRLGRRSEAFVELAVADLLGGADAESLSTLGRLHLAANRVDDAAAVARRAVDMQPELQGPRYVLGRVLMRQGHADEAREQFTVFQHIRDRTMDDQRRSFEVDKLRTVAARQAEAGLWHDVASTWVRIVEQMPGVPEFRVAAGAALAAIGALPEAAEHLEEAAVLGAGPDAQRRLAEVYANLGRQADSDRARESYERQVKELLRAAPRTAP